MSLLTSIVGHWQMNAASGASEPDSSPSGNTLLDTNTCGTGTGKIGAARTFNNAAGRFLSIADNASLSMGDIDFAIAVWVNVTNLTNLVSPVRKRTASANTNTEYRIDINTNGSVTFAVGNGTTSSSITSGASVIPTGTWKLIIAWHDSVNNTLNLQIDNATPVTPVSYSGGSQDTGGAFEIGRSQGNVLFFEGSIDSVSVWKKVLDSTDRANLWNGGAGLDYSGFAGGTTYNETVTETSTPSDTQTSVVTFVSAVTEVLNVTHAQTCLAVFASAVSESVTPTDTQTSLAVFASSITESATPTDAQTSVAVFVSTANESVTLSEAQTSLAVFVSDQTESASPNDSQSGLLVIASDLTESLTGSDAQTGGLLFTVNLTETQNVTDAQTAAASFACDLSDTSSPSDACATNLVMLAAITEAATLSDAVLATGVFSLVVADLLAISDEQAATVVVSFGLASPLTGEFVENSLFASFVLEGQTMRVFEIRFGDVGAIIPVEVRDKFGVVVMDQIPAKLRIKHRTATVEKELNPPGFSPDFPTCFVYAMESGDFDEWATVGRHQCEVRVELGGGEEERTAPTTTSLAIKVNAILP